MRAALVVGLVVTAATPSRADTCGAGVPAAACAKHPGLTTCAITAAERVGEWRYALVAPLYTPIQDVPSATLAAAWKSGQLPGARKNDPPIKLAASRETIAALSSLLGGPGNVAELTGAPSLDDTHWAIVPAHTLVPAWRAISIDGVHPLDPSPSALAVALCAPATTARVRNIDPAKLTTIAVTGTTAPTRMMSKLLDAKGPAYPLKDIQPWLDAADFVHLSQEVPVFEGCVPPERGGRKFCARPKDLKLLETAKVKIVELTGGHVVDYGADGLAKTIALYEARGWTYFGGGKNQIDATAPRLFEHRGNKFAFLGCNMAWTPKRIRDGAAVGACDLERMEDEMRRLRVHGYVPLVSIQHEEINEHVPHSSNVADFQRLAEAGAAFVHGSQAHVAQPWDVHHGAYVHYGSGNFLFDQSFNVKVSDGVANKLYLHDGKLLAVSQLFTRLEEAGRPRPLSLTERATLVSKLVTARRALKKTKPEAALKPYTITREMPDSFLVARELHYVRVKAPLVVEPGKKYPLILDLANTGATDDGAYVVTSRRKRVTLVDAAKTFLLAKYPVDASRVTIARARR